MDRLRSRPFACPLCGASPSRPDRPPDVILRADVTPEEIRRAIDEFLEREAVELNQAFAEAIGKMIEDTTTDRTYVRLRVSL